MGLKCLWWGKNLKKFIHINFVPFKHFIVKSQMHGINILHVLKNTNIFTIFQMKFLSILLISLTLTNAQDAEEVTTLSNNIQQPGFNGESNSLVRTVESVGDDPANVTRVIGKSITAVRRLLDNGVTVENNGRVQLGTCKPSLTTEVTYVNVSTPTCFLKLITVYRIEMKCK